MILVKLIDSMYTRQILQSQGRPERYSLCSSSGLEDIHFERLAPDRSTRAGKVVDVALAGVFLMLIACPARATSPSLKPAP